MNRIISALTVALIIMALPSCRKNSTYILVQGYAQGGVYSVKFNMSGVNEAPEHIKAHIDSLLEEIDNSLSGYNKSSYLSRWNEGERSTRNAMFDDILEISRDYYDKTGGVVNVAAAPLFDIWGFGFTEETMPDSAKVAQTLANCDIYNPSALNFNAIAQGYSCDLIASYLHSLGVHDMLVDIGEIFCEGLNPSGQNWKIGVDSPIDGNNDPGAELQGTMETDGRPAGVVTSGNYRKFYVEGGKKYSHTIDPRSGYPVSHNLLSATIVAPDATCADAYATYCMAIGLSESIAFVESHDELEGYFIFDDDGRMSTWHSEGFNLTSSK